MDGDTALVREATSRVDERGRLAASDVPGVRGALERLRTRAAAIDHPAQLFGRWHTLPSGARDALRAEVERDTRAVAGLYPHGSLWTGAIRGCWTLDRHLAGRRPASRLRQLAIRAGVRLEHGPLNYYRKARSVWSRRRVRVGPRVGVGDLPAALGRDPRWLLGDFVEGVRFPESLPMFRQERGGTGVTAYHLGLDLMPTPRGICLLEANIRAGMTPNRFDLPGRRLATCLTDLARDEGLRRVVWFESQKIALDRLIAESIVEESERSGVPFEVLEDPCHPREDSRVTACRDFGVYRALDRVPPGSLVVQRHLRLGGADHLLNHKEPSIRALDAWLRETGATGFFVARMTREPRLVDEVPPGYPNLVYKYPDSGMGRGVFFLRARDADHARTITHDLDRRTGDGPGLFQPFVTGRLADGERAFDTRAEILLTPTRVRFVRGFLRISAHPVPTRLEEGLVADSTIFAANHSRGGALVGLGEWEEEIRAAALAVGEAFRQILNRTFDTGVPAPSGEPV